MQHTYPSLHTHSCIYTGINKYTKMYQKEGHVPGFAVFCFFGFFFGKFSDILCCCGPYSYNSYHIFSHIAITEDQEEDEEDEDSDYMAYVHISSILDG